VAAGTHAADLSALGLPAGQYSFFVKAVGKPTLLNQMSGAVSYTVAAPAVMLAVTPTSGIAPVTVTASTAGSSCSGATIASTQINFGDGTVVKAASASHAYNSAGTYTVTATATGSNGLTGTAQQKVTITANKPPVVALSVSPASGSAPLSVTASTAGSTAPNGSIASTSIDFGDGTAAASGASASHVYSAAGSFTVKATVTDNVGTKGSAQTSVSITAAAPVQSSGVAVTAPVSSSSVSNPVKFVATASAKSAKITAMKIYVDSVSKYSVNAASINTTLTLSSGSRHITVQAWDSTGAVYKNSFTITVK
jgi:PKD repeat protein